MQSRDRLAPTCLFLLLRVVFACQVFAAQHGTERFRLHKFAQPIGWETVKSSESGGGTLIESTFSFTDRGTAVPLKATLRCLRDRSAESLSVVGSIARTSTIDLTITLDRGRAKVRDGKEEHTVATPRVVFPSAGYAQVAEQEALVAYWRTHGQPTVLPILPDGRVQIVDRGKDRFTLEGKTVVFERYSVSGLVWGVETVWENRRKQLAAVVTRDAEFDHFEAVREEYEPLVNTFIAAAARDSVDRLRELAGGARKPAGGETLAITGATLIDSVTSASPLNPATIIVEGGKIVAASPAAATAVPAKARRIDAAGKYVIPGLWDMHAHYEQVEWGPIYLAAGVTTVRDCGNEFEFIRSVRDANNTGTGVGPHIELAGVVDGDGPIALGVARVNTPADVETWVNRYHAAGFRQMKIYSSVKLPMLKLVCQRAHALGMSVTGHIPEGITLSEALDAGMDQVNHIPYILAALYPPNFDRMKASVAQRLAALQAVDVNGTAARGLVADLRRRGTVIDDTAALFELLAHPANEPGTRFVAPELRAQFAGIGTPPDRQALAELNLQKTRDLIGTMHRAGVPFVAGTDQGVPGFTVYRELELYVAAGFTPFEALQAATIVPARVLGVADESGSIAPGKRADLVILDVNPLDDIHNIRQVHAVVANGILYDPAPLWRAAGFTPPR